MDADKGGKIYELIPKIMAEVGAVEKGRRNATQGYQFRGIDDVYNALHGVLATNGVFFVPEVLQTDRQQAGTTKNGAAIWSVTLRAAFTFFASDGSSVRAVTAGEGMDSGDKATNKAMSAALKYALLDVFCIPTEEQRDSEYESPEVSATSPKVSRIRELIQTNGVPANWEQKTLKAAGVSRWEDMPADKLDKCITHLSKPPTGKAA